MSEESCRSVVGFLSVLGQAIAACHYTTKQATEPSTNQPIHRSTVPSHEHPQVILIASREEKRSDTSHHKYHIVLSNDIHIDIDIHITITSRQPSSFIE
mmetsp:Transcript_21131/g.58786  ORF Transcript_21131/g.58786 Transcript_21131/m.58786 type:complete len:99 (-) Transcript_21131:1134-1430(-)